MEAAVKHYLQQIHSVFERHRLQNVISEGDYLKKFADQVGHLRPHYNKSGEVDFQELDLLYLILETRFSIANALLFSESGLTDFEISHTEYGPVGHFFGGEVDTRFFYFVDDVFMRLYNFWNRVGNFLNIFFGIESDEEKVYFAPLIDKLSTAVEADPNFTKLKAFRDGEYKEIVNKRRRRIVHRRCSSHTYFESFLGNVQNPDELSKLQQERDELAGFFVASYRRMVQGLDEMLALIRDNIKCDTKAS